MPETFTSSTELLTMRDLVKILGVPRYRIAYAAEIYNIEPAIRAGMVKLYRPDQIASIKSALQRTAQRAGGGGQ